MIKKADTIWDVAVIGGGAAGMMAAGRAASLGASVIVIEKNKTLGRKLLITGGGRCNVTNAEQDIRKFVAKFKESDKFLFSPFSQWSVTDTLNFFHSHNMQTKEEALGRVFPLSGKAQSVWDVLVANMKEFGVTVLPHSQVKCLNHKDSLVTSVLLKNGDTVKAQTFILATGGTSHPETGSTGDGYRWLRELGHTVNEARPALVPLVLVNPATTAAGVSLDNARITILQNEVRQERALGKVLFTHVGLSGPGILNQSRAIGELLQYGEVIIELDLLPEIGYEKVNILLQNIFKEHSKKMLKNSFSSLSSQISPALLTTLFTLANTDPDILCGNVSKEMRIRLMKTVKHMRFEVSHLLGKEKAVITAGGLILSEVNLKTMQSTKYTNLYVAGDILDIDRPSGGYSLQLCWTTGFIAGSSAVAFT